MASKAETTITFHSGILTIGGTIIEVAYKDAHIFFDFGSEYHPENPLQDEALQTFVDNRWVPELSDVFDSRLDYTYQGESVKKFTETAVFLSHAHLDHSKIINYLAPEIPLYTLAETKAILEELNRDGEFLTPSPFEAKSFVREMIGLKPRDVIQVGEISVEIWPVDHDAFGAAALLIRTPERLITYTGDLRLHGYHPEITEAFAKAAFQTDILMMEGVSISFPEREENPEEIKIISEADLIQRLVAIELANPKRQLTFNGYPANVERFLHIVEESPRTVVLEANQASLVQEIFGKAVPYYYTKSAKNPDLNPALEISYSELLADDEKYLWQAVTDFDALQAGGLYLHLDAQPLGDFDPAYAKFLALLAENQIEFVRLAVSGHAFPADLEQIIAWIQPKILVPIHTLKPEKLENPYGERILPTRGQKIVL